MKQALWAALTPFLALFIVPAAVFAATYYVDGSAATDDGTGSSASPKKYIKSGIALMAGGDTLIIRDGVYSGVNNNMCRADGWEWSGGIPNGTADAYTTIRAERDFGVIIDGGGAYTGFYPAHLSYCIVQGIVFRNGGSNVYLYYCDHIKVIKCAGCETSAGNVCNFNSAGGDYILFEDCFAWGTGRYKFLIGRSTAHTVLRRCVGRYDYHDAEGPHGVFSFYGFGGGDNVAQNCLAVNSLAASGHSTTALYAPNGSTRMTFDSCIVVDNAGAANFFESSADHPAVKNCVLWQGSNVGSQMYTEPVNASVSGCTIGAVTSMGISAANCTVRNTIIYGTGGAALNRASNDYCDLYNNNSNYSNTSAGPHNIAVNPLGSALRYLPRIEAGSALKTAGEGGAQIGAEIVKRLGVSGTLYGETGWNALTDENLWPFPNEDAIRAHMRAYTAHGVNGTRGFCADGTTLTRYIWEYLGNAIPAGIYGDTPGTPSNLMATALSSIAVSLTWSASPLWTTAFRIERKTGIDGTYARIADAGPDDLSYIDGDVSPNLTYHYRIMAYNDFAASGYSNEVWATPPPFPGDTAGDSLGNGTVRPGDIKVVGSAKGRGLINPDKGDTAKIFFAGSSAGTFEAKIFTVTGRLVWQDSMDAVQLGMFEWPPGGAASGSYVVLITGPGLNAKKKIIVLR